jgi:hypothetical protein
VQKFVLRVEGAPQGFGIVVHVGVGEAGFETGELGFQLCDARFAAENSFERGGGLQGRVLRAPAQPVCVSLRPCSTPVSVVLAFFRSGRERAHVRSSRNGEYRVSLAPGRYSVRVAHRHPLWRALPQTVRVPVGRYARVNFFVDTGIQ